MTDERQRDAARASDLRSFGRRRGRKLSPRQETLLHELLPRVAIAPSTLKDEIASGALSDRELWLEIGFGGAEHLIWQARHSPATTVIGCEPFEEGLVKALTAIDEQDFRNIRIYPDDGRHVLRALPDASISRAFVLFPDPWPKRKHVKRRLINPDTVAMLARVLKPGALLRIGTDIGDYVRTLLLALNAHPAFVWCAEAPADWRVRPADWPQTRYEQKALREGRRGYFFQFVRTVG